VRESLDGNFDFRDLFVFDMANNHQGSVEHGLRIIDECGAVTAKHGVRAALKFQFRQLDSFIHPSHRQGSTAKHIPRFLETRLAIDQYQKLYDAVRAANLMTMCTPFDEESVDVIVGMKFDILKIASSSARDWPLIEKAADSGLPIVFSTGGLDISSVDDLVSYFTHRGVEFAIMHCVSIYPTPPEDCHLNRIDLLRRRYPGRVVGWSTHENPDDTSPIQVAVAKGARMFERHVGITTDTIKLNAYSSTPQQVDRWLAAYKHAVALCGPESFRPTVPVEREALDSLRRGVFAKKPIRAGQMIDREHVYFAMPYEEGQFESGAWKPGIVAKANFHKDAPLAKPALELPPTPEWHLIKAAIHDVKALLNEAAVPLNSQFQVEFSHHHGMESFREVGAVLIDCVNRSYCKKIVVQLPRQKHPAHFHKQKEETFQVLHGTLHLDVDGHRHTLYPGQTILIQPGVWHSFWTETGCVFEEISTTHVNDDSFYADKRINQMARNERKTVVDHWGRFQTAPASALPGVDE
jgi:sialic acid synthase SpsE/D-lyxose ketol-isomerase